MRRTILYIIVFIGSIAHAARIPTILDTDANNELDDQHAIAYLIFNSDVFEVLGITTNKTRNGGDITQHTAEAERVVKLCAAEGAVPVKSGANGDYNTIQPTLNNSTFDGKEAVDFIIQQAHVSRSQKLVMLPVGKLTNIALALEKDPTIIPKVKVVWLGSNWPSGGEYNLDNDKPSVNAVLATQVEIWVCTVGGGTAAVKASTADINSKMPGKGPYVDPAVPGRHGGTFHYFGDYSVSLFANVSQTSRSLYDMAAVATVKDPSWAQPTVVGAPLLNTSDGSWTARDTNPRKVTFYRNYDVNGVMNDFWDTMDQPAIGGPYAVFSVTVDDLKVNVDGSASIPTKGDSITSYAWDFGDNTTKSGRIATHTYADYGKYTITLAVEEQGGNRDTSQQEVYLHDGNADNQPDASVNLALLPTAVLSGNAGARGSTRDILYDPGKNDYVVTTDWNEYGVAFGQNLGKVMESNAFYWMVEWPIPKYINYLTFGGTYPNQPQEFAMWKIQYRQGTAWSTVEAGQGGWVNSGIYEWKATTAALVADAVRVLIYSDGTHDLTSIHLRGRGGKSNNEDDSQTTPKATLVQYRPDGVHLCDPRVLFPAPFNIIYDRVLKCIFLSGENRYQGKVQLSVFDVTGTLVESIEGKAVFMDGINTETWASGVYTVRFYIDGKQLTRQFLITK